MEKYEAPSMEIVELEGSIVTVPGLPEFGQVGDQPGSGGC